MQLVTGVTAESYARSQHVTVRDAYEVAMRCAYGQVRLPPPPSPIMSFISRPYSARNNSSRPATAASRPGTARPQTAASSPPEGRFIIALLEGRGVGREVGMAALDKETGRVALIQVTLSFCTVVSG